MPRKEPQELSGSTVSNPVASPVSTFAIRDFSAASNAAPVAPHLLDFSGLSRTLQGFIDERRTFDEEARTALGRRVADLQEQGLSQEEILKKVSESGSAPRRVAGWLAKRVQAGTLDEIDNPAFRLGLESRRGEAAVAEYERALADAKDRVAQQVAAAEAGSENQVALQALGELRSDLGKTLEGLGFFGARAAEPLLQRAHERFLDAVSATQRQLRREEYRLLAGESFQALAAQYSEAGTQDEKEALLKEFSAQVDKIHFDGVENPQGFLEDQVRVAAGKINLNAGPEAAAEFAKELYDNLTNGKGNHILADTDALGLLGDIGRYEQQADSERERALIKADAKVREYGAKFREELGPRLSEAAAGGAAQVIAEAEEFRQTLLSDPESLGVSPEEQGSALVAFDNLRESYMQSAATARSVLDSKLKGEMLQLVVEEGLSSAMERMESLSLDATTRFDIESAMRQVGARESAIITDQLLSTGVKDELFTRALESIVSPDTQPTDKDMIYARSIQRDLFLQLVEAEVRAGTENPDYGSQYNRLSAEKAVKDFMTRAETILNPRQPAPKTDAKEIADNLRAQRRVSSLEIEVGPTFQGNTGRTLGGVEIDAETPQSVINASKYFSRRPREEGTAALQYLERIAKDPDIPDSRKVREIGQAWAASGRLNSAELVALVTGRGTESFPAGPIMSPGANPFGAQTLTGEESSAPGASLTYLEQVTSEDINPFTTRLADFKNADTFIRKDPVYGTAILTPEFLNDTILVKKLELLLEAFDIEPSQANAASFIMAQRTAWASK